MTTEPVLIAYFMGVEPLDGKQMQATHVELTNGEVVPIDQVPAEVWRASGFVPPVFTRVLH